MTRKEIEKDSDRPHYYSQFWLDVAAGRRVIGQPKPEEGEILEPEPELMAAPPRRPLRAVHTDINDGRAENIVHPVAEPLAAPDAFIDPEVEELEDGEELDFAAPVEDADIPDMDLEVDDDEEEEEGFEGEEEEEEEDDIGWGGGRARKKAKPTRPVKPAAKKAPRREPRRGY